MSNSKMSNGYIIYNKQCSIFSAHRALRPQGCFNKASLSEDSLNTDMTQRLVNVTNSKCQKICEEEGYEYAGVYMVWVSATLLHRRQNIGINSPVIACPVFTAEHFRILYAQRKMCIELVNL